MRNRWRSLGGRAGGIAAGLVLLAALAGLQPGGKGPARAGAAAADPADLSMTISDSPDPVTSGSTLTYTLKVHNAGPDPATNTVVTDSLPGGVTLVSATATGGGTCAVSSGKETCNLGTVTTTTDRTITIQVTVKKSSGQLTNSASVTSDVTDPTPSNNLDSETTTIKKPPKPSKAKCDGQKVTILGTAGPDTLFGTNGNDVISALQGDDTIYGSSGGDIICGGPGTDVIRSGPGNDVVLGGSGSDFIWGRRGDDSLHGGRGRDRLRGGPGDDLLAGGPGFDRCHGGRGRDTLRSCERGR
jgi:uncharacterized repeat protein (TIGR01451 family)